MTMPASGTISMSQINTELGRSSSAALNLNDSTASLLRGSSSNPVSLNNFYGKTRFVIVAGTVNAFTTGYSHASAASPAGSATPNSDGRIPTLWRILTLNSGQVQLQIVGNHAQVSIFTSFLINGITSTLLASSASLHEYVSSENFTRWSWSVGAPQMTTSQSYSVYIN